MRAMIRVPFAVAVRGGMTFEGVALFASYMLACLLPIASPAAHMHLPAKAPRHA
jgi:hypothetical protein